MVTLRSNNSEKSFTTIKKTADFGRTFSRGADGFQLYDVSGTDLFIATLTFAAPIQIYKQGTFPTDDFIKVTIADDLTSGIAEFDFVGFGFERDF